MTIKTTNPIALQILNEANNNIGKEPSPEFIAAFNANGKQATTEERQIVRLDVAQSLDSVQSASGVGFIGIWLGGVVENGADPELYLPFLLPRFTSMIKQLSFIGGSDPVEDLINGEAEVNSLDGNDQEDQEEYYAELADTPENNELLIGLEYLGQALVAHLARSSECRKNTADDDEFMNLLNVYDGYSAGITWVLELLCKHSDDLIVLHVEKKMGVRVLYENLSNCFHLFTLFQEAVSDILPHDIDDEEDEDEKNEIEDDDFEEDNDDDFFDHAWWHYGQGSSPEADILSSIWGEMTPKGISIIDGEQVMLLWPHIMASRSWDDGFFHPLLEAAPASVTLLNVLSDNEVSAWFKRLNLDTNIDLHRSKEQ